MNNVILSIDLTPEVCASIGLACGKAIAVETFKLVGTGLAIGIMAGVVYKKIKINKKYYLVRGRGLGFFF